MVIILCSLFASCGIKHKTQYQDSEKKKQQKQEQIQSSLLSEKIIQDTNYQFKQIDLQQYAQWILLGNVRIHPKGGIETDSLILQSWHYQADRQQETLITYFQDKQVSENQYTTHQTSLEQTKARYKVKRKASTNWWFLLLMVGFVLFWFYTIRRSRNLS